MENHSKENSALNQEHDKFQKGNHTDLNDQNLGKGYSDNQSYY